MNPAGEPSTTVTNNSVGSCPSRQGRYLAVTAARSASSRHHLATCGCACHRATSGKSSLVRGRKEITLTPPCLSHAPLNAQLLSDSFYRRVPGTSPSPSSSNSSDVPTLLWLRSDQQQRRLPAVAMAAASGRRCG